MKLKKTNISIMEVRNCIGYSSMDLGTLCSCGEPYINKWAKYKPVDLDYPSELYDSRPVKWWKGNDGNCGIICPTFRSFEELIASYKGGNQGNLDTFKYQGPKGGAHSPYRLGDFAGYNTASLPPIFQGACVNQLIINDSLKSGITFRLLSQTPDEDELTVNDIFGDNWVGLGGQVYYGVAIREKGSTNWIWDTTRQPFTVGNEAEIFFKSGNFKINKEYEAIQFLTNFHLASGPSSNDFPGVTNKLIPIPKKNNYIEYIQHFEVVKSTDVKQEEELNGHLIHSTIKFYEIPEFNIIQYNKLNYYISLAASEKPWTINNLTLQWKTGYTGDKNSGRYLSQSLLAKNEQLKLEIGQTKEFSGAIPNPDLIGIGQPSKLIPYDIYINQILVYSSMVLSESDEKK